MASLFDRLMHRRVLRRWGKAAQEAEAAELETLRALRSRARQMRRELDRVLHVAEGRLTLPVIGSTAMRKPLGTDWSWRPELWSGPVSPAGQAGVETRARIGSEVTVFHDCADSGLTLRQVRNTRAEDLAPFGLRLDVLQFDGSFLSLAVDLPEAAVQGLKLRHVIRLDTVIEREAPLEVFARLNIKHGPNTEQIVRELPPSGGETMAEFDLAYTRMNEKRVERAWVDLIFEGPQMNQVLLRDLTFSRRPRADL
ncbi:DUF6478 family protein [Frigidibacter oleivorans]|uniref:DUF6478 family protein n=1 Tax=Frigidibacter oleivorans TaxID=2487129 RepID=UPI000F8F261F|nr:DUF6478 family protein [Frigidibacter oleivorans]